MKLKSILLAVIGLSTLYGCGGGSSGGEEKPSVKTAEPVLDHVTIPNAVLYKAEYRNPDQQVVLSTGFALKYQKIDGENSSRWSIWAKNSLVTTWWWVKQSSDDILKSDPNSVQLTSISRRINRNVASGSIPAVSVINQVDIPYNNIVHVIPEFHQNQPVYASPTHTELDLSGTGTSMHIKWAEKISLQELTTRAINTDSWNENNGYSTDMLGNVETTRNGEKVTVTMMLPAAGCTLVGDAISSGKTRFDKFVFTGFDKCLFDPAKGDKWTPSDYINSERLAKGKNGSIAYGATFKDNSGLDTLVIGFPELDGVVLMMNKRK
ncbi:hypothetical protein [Aeromonas finlandensis]|uniref:hypothetical protein n=1 Tax=Aeromonas finlandensis TaxID=1543375 RepID=UPI000B2EEF7E|nr:hypothetical protein [Aeromonas finlandensis]